MSELEIERLKQEISKLQIENKAAFSTIEKLLRDLSQKTEKLKHMESLVTQAVPVVKKEFKTTVSAAEEIAVQQLERLRQTSKNRVLTLEEARMYDLLVKNQRLSQDESTINLSKTHYRDVAEADLIQIAAKEIKISDESDT